MIAELNTKICLISETVIKDNYIIYPLCGFPNEVVVLNYEFCRELLADLCGDNLLLFDGTVTCTFFYAFEFFDYIHALDDFTKDCVVHV